MYTPKNKIQRKRVATSLAADSKMSLAGFRSTYVPDVECIKLVYSDYRVLTASVNQAEYVYRLNSCFDPDQTGVGGQPDGFDFWKQYYTIYRVVAAEVEVQCTANTVDGNGLLAIAATDASGAYLSAEEVAGLRKAKSCVFSQMQRASLRGKWHMSELFGRNDQSILSDNECSALTTASPTAQQYLHVAIEVGNSAAGATMVWSKITYYVRFERAIATLDSVSSHKRLFLRFPGTGVVPPETRTADKTADTVCDVLTNTADTAASSAVAVVCSCQVPRR